MNNELIKATKLTKVYRRGSEQVFALKDASFTVSSGEFLAIVGPSGSGKTTLLNLLGCLDKPTWGSLKLDGVEIGDQKEGDLARLRREKIGFVFQQFFLLPTLTVKENIELPLLFSKKKRDEGALKEIIDIVGLSSRASHLPHQLSGGEMQRVAIGRALVNSPEILLADEPTGNLDSVTAETIYQLFLRLNQQGLTIIVVTHNPELANIARRIIRLKDGKIINDGTIAGR